MSSGFCCFVEKSLDSLTLASLNIMQLFFPLAAFTLCGKGTAW
jgi:hypothetical protein